MKNLSEVQPYTEIINRIKQLQAENKPAWGKMNAGQMLAHVQETFKVPLSDKPMPRLLLGRLIGWAFKPVLYNDKPWKRNLPTSPNFIIKNERDFENEKKDWIRYIVLIPLLSLRRGMVFVTLPSVIIYRKWFSNFPFC